MSKASTTSHNVPKIRFPAFKGDWEVVKLGQLVKLINGLTYSPADIRDEGLLVLRSSNVQNGSIDLSDSVFVNHNVDDLKKTKVNDILLCVRNGSQRLIGKSALIKSDLGNATHGAFMSVLRGDSNKFIFQFMQGQSYYQQVHKNLGATINSINGSDLRKFILGIPQDTSEMDRIVEFLSTIDNKISILTRKRLLLEKFKKSSAQNIFSQHVRFKNDDDKPFPNWKRKRLGDIATIKKGKGISKADIHEDGKTECIRYGQLYTDYGPPRKIAPSQRGQSLIQGY